MPEEMLPLNKHPLNQKAKEFLLQVKESPHPDSLYALQLAQWGIEKEHLRVPYEVEETLNVMVTWDQKRVMKMLTGENPRDPREGFCLEIGPKEPIDLAWAVLDQLVSALTPMLHLTPKQLLTMD